MFRISASSQLLKSMGISLLVALVLTTLCYGQASYEGPSHNVIYSNGDDGNGNDAFPALANSAYTDVIVNFLTVDTNCQLDSQPYVSPGDMQALHNAGMTVLVSFGDSRLRPIKRATTVEWTIWPVR